MKKYAAAVMVAAAVVLMSAAGAQAEFRAWAPVNANFVGGNALNGQWLLNKEQATNEYADDKLERMMKELMTHIDNLTQSIGDHLDNLNLTLQMPTLMQVGSNNTGAIGTGGALGPATATTPTSASGALSGFKPSFGIE